MLAPEKHPAAVLLCAVLLAATVSTAVASDPTEPNPTSPDALAASPAGFADWLIYQDDVHGVRIAYPPDLRPTTTGRRVVPGAVVAFVPAYDPTLSHTGKRTNLLEFSIEIGVIRNPACANSGDTTPFPDGPRSTDRDPTQILLPDPPITRVVEGAAGNRYETLSVRAVYGSFQYEIALFLHYASLDCFVPGSIAPFDDTKLCGIFEAMLRTFAVLPVDS